MNRRPSTSTSYSGNFWRAALWSLIAMLLLLPLNRNLQAQNTTTTTGSLRGQVTDPSGAVISNATILITTPKGDSLDTTTNKDGNYEFQGLAPGTYTIKAVAPGFTLFTQEKVQISTGQPTKVNISLAIEEQQEKVTVTDSATKVEVDPEKNANSIVMQGKDLEALSDDPDELQSELQALAGPSAGPNGGQMYIDGFTAGQLPPKSSIREIRINQNPFSAEYDKLGYGRIEIFTKPGTDNYHGQLFFSGTTAAFNSRNPFESIPAGQQPPSYESTQFFGNLGGPLSKKASFFVNVEGRNVNDLNVVNTPIVDQNFQINNDFSQFVPNPGQRINIGPRLDYQLTPTNTLTVRYQYFRNSENNEGVGQFNLAENGYNALNIEHTVQISDTQTISARTINETRFQFVRADNSQTPLNTSPTIQIQGAFTGGGSNSGTSDDLLDRYELQNYTSMSLGKHFLKYGLRVRENSDNNFSNADFNGQFSFGPRTNLNVCQPTTTSPVLTGLEAYQNFVMGLANGQAVSTLIACGFGPSEYTVSASQANNPRIHENWVDAGLYAQDDWRARPNITISYGLRFETQNHLSDHADFAPRLGLAWGIGGNAKNPPKTVLRAGFGIFYDRFTYDLVAEEERLNGVITEQFIYTNPPFYIGSTPPPGTLQASIPPTTYAFNSNLHAPYTIQTGITVERQLTKYANLAVTYLNSRGDHALFINNINAPNPANNGVRPIDPTGGNIFQYESGGIFKQNQLIINSSVRMGTKLSLFGYYTLNYADSDTGGTSYFPSNPYDPAADYGRASFDVRHRVFLGGTSALPYGFRLSPFLIASSGTPFNVTTGEDPFDDFTFNQRAAFASCSSASPTVKQTRFGCFDSVPQAGETLLPINYLTGPAHFSLNLRLSKTFGLGKKTEAANNRATGGGPGQGGTFGRGPGGPGGGPGGGRGGGGGGGFRGFGDTNATGQRYSLTFAVNARNIFNNVNLATPVGNLGSPLFGESNGLAGQPFSSATANRRIDLQVMFSF